jgi:hypothetical protein
LLTISHSKFSTVLEIRASAHQVRDKNVHYIERINDGKPVTWLLSANSTVRFHPEVLFYLGIWSLHISKETDM